MHGWRLPGRQNQIAARNEGDQDEDRQPNQVRRKIPQSLDTEH